MVVGLRVKDTYVVVGTAVTLVAPVKLVPNELHLPETFLSHPLPCSASIRPSGLVGLVTRPDAWEDVRVGKVVRDELV
jgi:hypothetical protein